MNKEIKGFIEDSYGLAEFEIRASIGENSEIEHVYCHGDLYDGIGDWDEFYQEFGDEYYDTLDDFKASNVKSIAAAFEFELEDAEAE
jgi:hypothetical protein